MELQRQEWLQDLAFLMDITEHLNILKKMFQGRKKVVTQFMRAYMTFKLKVTVTNPQ